MSSELEIVSKALTDIDAVSAGIAQLRERFEGVVFDVATSAGMEEARAARVAIREPRYNVERIRKDAKRPLLDLGKKLDAEAARIERELLKIEEPIDAQIKAEEKRKEDERKAKVEAEMKRIEALQERVAELRGCQMLTAASGSALIAEHIADLDRIQVDDSFQEYRQQAADAKIAGLARLRDLHSAAISHEQEQERIQAERAELARLREEQARRDAEARRQREEEERQAAAQRAKERAEHEAQLKAQREEAERVARERQAALDAEHKRIAETKAAQDAAAQAERDKLAAERAAFERQQAEDRRAREEEAQRKAEQARLASIKRPPESEIIGVLAKHYNVPDSKVAEWLAASRWKKVAA